jgi:hypothetical protein
MGKSFLVWTGRLESRDPCLESTWKTNNIKKKEGRLH